MAGSYDPEALAERLQQFRGDTTYSELARRLSASPETVRRSFLSGRPSVALLTELCATQRVCANWLLTGQSGLDRDTSLRSASSEALLAELKLRMEGEQPSPYPSVRPIRLGSASTEQPDRSVTDAPP